MKYLPLILILFYVSVNPQGSWERIDSPTDKTLRDLFFLDSLNGWIGGDSAVIYKTTDGGLSWQQQYQNDEHNITDFYFLNADYGWAVSWPEDGLLGVKSLMLKTTNGGDTWIEEFYPTEDVFLFTVFYQDTLNGWMGGDKATITYTTNGGERWHLALVDSGSLSYVEVLCIKFYNDTLVVASGGSADNSGVFWFSHDAGRTWESKLVWIDPVVQFYFIDSTHFLGFAKDTDGAYGSGTLRSYDAGETWTYTNFDYGGPATGVVFRNSTEIWLTLSIDRNMMFSADTGHTWQLIPSPENSSIYKLQFTDSTHGFGVGEFGVIIKYVEDSVTGTEGNNISPYTYKLYQNYPNPFNPSSIIFYELASPGNVNLTIYDIMGNEVAVLVNEYKQVGNYSAEFNSAQTRKLASGVYFCRMNSGKFSSIIKMLLLK